MQNQRNLQQRIEAQGKKLQKMFEEQLKASRTVMEPREELQGVGAAFRAGGGRVRRRAAAVRGRQRLHRYPVPVEDKLAKRRGVSASLLCNRRIWQMIRTTLGWSDFVIAKSSCRFF